MPYFARRPTTVFAEQYLDPDHPPKGVNVTATGIHYVVTMQGQRVAVHPGEWIVTEHDGVHHYPVASDVFAEVYELVPEIT